MGTYRGRVRGNTIELEGPLPYEDGQPVQVSIEPLAVQPRRGSAAAILQVMDQLRRLAPEDVDEFMRAIEAGQLPVCEKGVFEEHD